MNPTFYSRLSEMSLAGEILPDGIGAQILTDPTIQLLPLLNAAFTVRQATWGNRVAIHIINNAQNGSCPEDCSYCAQSKNSKAPIEEYWIKPDQEILAEAKVAYESGAFRYCMVFSGRGPTQKRVEKLAALIREVKATYPIEVCVSCGLVDEEGSKILKAAGLDRLNHNLNTGRDRYGTICSTHTYQDRINTLRAAKAAGIETCSGMILGMGETTEDVIEVANTLRELNSKSIPINFLIPIEGNVLQQPVGLTPEYCLRVLCLFRFLNPKCELRAGAGREYHLRSLQNMALYAANSIFMDGYLNTKGDDTQKTLQMIQDLGFSIDSTLGLEAVMARLSAETPNPEMKGTGELRKCV